MPDTHLLAVARGQVAADLLFRGGTVANVLTGELESADVAVAGGRVAGVGPGYEAREVVDVGGRFLAPGLIDAHVHIESSHIGMGFNSFAYYVTADRLAQPIDDWKPFEWPPLLRCFATEPETTS